MQKAVQNKNALYCRLSVDDNCNGESDSIQNQRLILQKYAKDHGFLDTVVFTDDGVSGTTFQRKGFQQMIDGIQAGKINTVIVKDL
ncbi:recombinase family protein [Pectinatus sottacetonis]|uniref:recombinase family protein n=1 Tax=Pectinatus sottacetonis TaxID=1002795 RepID=UPI0018C54A8F|nr:recombinase family protein [Pectinatus sottacetonis]